MKWVGGTISGVIDWGPRSYLPVGISLVPAGAPHGAGGTPVPQLRAPCSGSTMFGASSLSSPVAASVSPEAGGQGGWSGSESAAAAAGALTLQPNVLLPGPGMVSQSMRKFVVGNNNGSSDIPGNISTSIHTNINTQQQHHLIQHLANARSRFNRDNNKRFQKRKSIDLWRANSTSSLLGVGNDSVVGGAVHGVTSGPSLVPIPTMQQGVTPNAHINSNMSRSRNNAHSSSSGSSSGQQQTAMQMGPGEGSVSITIEEGDVVGGGANNNRGANNNFRKPKAFSRQGSDDRSQEDSWFGVHSHANVSTDERFVDVGSPTENYSTDDANLGGPATGTWRNQRQFANGGEIAGGKNSMPPQQQPLRQQAQRSQGGNISRTVSNNSSANNSSGNYYHSGSGNYQSGSYQSGSGSFHNGGQQHLRQHLIWNNNGHFPGMFAEDIQLEIVLIPPGFPIPGPTLTISPARDMVLIESVRVRSEGEFFREFLPSLWFLRRHGNASRKRLVRWNRFFNFSILRWNAGALQETRVFVDTLKLSCRL